MKFIAVLATVFSVAVAGPDAVFTPLIASISSQYHSQDALGQYSYGYTNQHSAKSEVKTADGIIHGGYSYIDAEGKLQSIEYTADSTNGFRATGSNLPVAPKPANLQAPVQVTETPEVAEARAKHEAAVEEAKVRSLQPVVAPQPLPLAQAVAFNGLPVSFRTSYVPTTNAVIAPHLVPGFSYSYGIHNGLINQPFITTYGAPFFFPITSNALTSSQLVQLPQAPAETPEVAKARAEHLQAVEKEKSRTTQ